MPVSPADAPTTVHLARDLWQGDGTGRIQDVDCLTREEPLEIRIGTAPIAVLMRTPGHDLDLVSGFVLTEGLFKSLDDIRKIVPCDSPAENDSDSLHAASNVMRVIPQDHVELDAKIFSRNFYATSSCGVCGKRSLEVAMKMAPALTVHPDFKASILAHAPFLLREHQSDFDKTGALHAAGLITTEGKLFTLREDIGRHNAVDKVIGMASRKRQDLSQFALIVSGRISFEIVQKALFARISCVVGVGGVSSLAAELAELSHMAVIGFANKEKLSIYSGAARIK